MAYVLALFQPPATRRPRVTEMVSFRVLLDDSAWTLAESKRAQDHAWQLQLEARNLILTYRTHRLRGIAGGSGRVEISDDQPGPQHLRTRVRFLAAQDEIPNIIARDSTGRSACEICRRARGTQEYEIGFRSLTFVVDRACFAFWRAEMFAARKRSAIEG